jgi:hypothetical protein
MMIKRKIKNGSMLEDKLRLKLTKTNIISYMTNNVIIFIILVLRRAEQYLKNKKLVP